MPVDVLDRLQQDKLERLEMLIGSCGTASDVGSADQVEAIATFIVNEGNGVRQSSLRLWDYHWAKALAGKIPDLREDGATLLSLLERAGEFMRRGATIARAYGEQANRDVVGLAEFEQQSRAFPLWLKECAARWKMLGRPRTPLNRERVAESQAAYHRGEGESVSEVVARLEQGGPLVQE